MRNARTFSALLVALVVSAATLAACGDDSVTQDFAITHDQSVSHDLETTTSDQGDVDAGQPD